MEPNRHRAVLSCVTASGEPTGVPKRGMQRQPPLPVLHISRSSSGVSLRRKSTPATSASMSRSSGGYRETGSPRRARRRHDHRSTQETQHEVTVVARRGRVAFGAGKAHDHVLRMTAEHTGSGGIR